MDDTESPLYPIFFSQVSDVALFGFDLEEDAVKGSEMEPPYTDPGYFFVFQEIATDMHFGMDYADPSEPEPNPLEVSDWNILDWSYFKDKAFIEISHAITKTSETVGTWRNNAAALSNILYQNPILLSIHAKDLLR